MSVRDPERYRPNVGLALFQANGLVFFGKRTNASGPHQWQMPQGGVDRGEAPAQAALRELEEEVGVTPALVEVLEEADDWLYYDFPEDVRARDSTRGRYLGQRQKWFALKFLGRDSDVHLDRHKPEFSDWRWGRLEEAPHLVIPFKRAVYEDVAQRFRRYSGGTQRKKADG